MNISIFDKIIGFECLYLIVFFWSRAAHVANLNLWFSNEFSKKKFFFFEKIYLATGFNLVKTDFISSSYILKLNLKLYGQMLLSATQMTFNHIPQGKCSLSNYEQFFFLQIYNYYVFKICSYSLKYSTKRLQIISDSYNQLFLFQCEHCVNITLYKLFNSVYRKIWYSNANDLQT